MSFGSSDVRKRAGLAFVFTLFVGLCGGGACKDPNPTFVFDSGSDGGKDAEGDGPAQTDGAGTAGTDGGAGGGGGGGSGTAGTGGTGGGAGSGGTGGAAGTGGAS